MLMHVTIRVDIQSVSHRHTQYRVRVRAGEMIERIPEYVREVPEAITIIQVIYVPVEGKICVPEQINHPMVVTE